MKWVIVFLVGVLLVASCAYYWIRSRPKEVTPQVDVVSKPIPQNPSARVEKDVLEQRVRWCERYIRDAYEKVGIHDKRWDQEARELIRTYILRAKRDAEAQDREEYFSLMEKIVKVKCTDPLILYLAASGAGLESNTRILEESVRRFPKTSYSKAVMFVAAHDLDQCYEELKMTEAQVQLDQTLLELLREAVRDESYRNEDWEILFDWPRDSDKSDFFIRKANAVHEILEQSPKVDKWIIEMLKGFVHLHQAWKEFDAWKKDHSTEEWEELRKKLEPAKIHLLKAYELNPSEPLISFGMMSVSLVDTESPKEKLREWFEKAVAAQFDFLRAYQTFANGISPRWYGSDQELLSFGYQCLETARFDTRVPFQYIATVINLGHSVTPDNRYAYFTNPEIYRNCKRALEGYLNEETQKAFKPYHYSQFAIIAYHAGEWQDSLKNLKAINFKLDYRALRTWKKDFSEIGDEVSAFAGSAGFDVYDAEVFFQKRELGNASKHYEKALENEKDERAIRYIKNKLGLLRFEQELDRGDWVKFIPPKDFNGWDVERGKWTILPSGVLEVKTGHQGSMLKSLARVGSDFEVHGEIEVVSSSNGAYEAGVIFGYPAKKKREWMSFRLENHLQKGTIASLSQAFYVPFKYQSVRLGARNRFFLQVWNEKVTAFINGKLLFKNETSPKEYYRMNADCLVGFGGYFDDNETIIHYHNLKLRRLTGKPSDPVFDVSGKLKID